MNKKTVNLRLKVLRVVNLGERFRHVAEIESHFFFTEVSLLFMSFYPYYKEKWFHVCFLVKWGFKVDPKAKITIYVTCNTHGTLNAALHCWCGP